MEPWGLAGDRRWMVVDEAGRFLTQRAHPVMARIAAYSVPGGLTLGAADGGDTSFVPFPMDGAPVLDVTVWRDTVRATLASVDASLLLTRMIGVSCRLVFLHDPQARATDPNFAGHDSKVSFADGFPVLLCARASLDDLNTRLTAQIPMLAFRPNVVVAGAAPWAEDGWRRIRIGAVVFSVVKPCERCAVTTIDPATGTRFDGREPLRTLARFRRDRSGGVMFGQNLVPETSGELHLGDVVEILDQGPPNVDLVAAGNRAG